MKFARSYAWTLVCALLVGCLSGCAGQKTAAEGETQITLRDPVISTEPVEPSVDAETEPEVEAEVTNKEPAKVPATGKQPESPVEATGTQVGLGDTVTATGRNAAAVTVTNDIIYYEDRTAYDSGNPYGEGKQADRHTAEEAAAHTVVNITQPGTYRVTGTLAKGQIRVDLGKEAKTDPKAVVTLILDGVDISCQVAPAILFLNVYECDNNWSAETASKDVDTSAAGANLVLESNSVNVVNGSYVARIYKDAEGEKKLWKQDGAIYSYMSMNVGGQGQLTINAENEGLDTELHLTINGGRIDIRSGNDGINTNEDGVSVTTINNGDLNIIAGLGQEGDGIDSNGWLVINGGKVFASAHPAADAGLDSDMGSYVNGGQVVAFGSTMDWAESDSAQVTINLQFAQGMSAKSLLTIRNEKGETIFLAPRAVEEDDPTANRTYRGAIISDAVLKQGETYTVYVDEVQQGYTGTDVMRGPGGFGGRPSGGQMGQRPEGQMPNFQGGERPSFQEGEKPNFQGGQMPGGNKGERPNRTEGEMPQFAQGEWPQFPNGQKPNFPEGQTPNFPEGEMPKWEGGEMPKFQGGQGQMPQRPEGGMPPFDGQWTTGQPEGEQLPASTEFYMQDMVNFFSGVQNAQ